MQSKPQRGKQGGILETESQGITNPKDDPSWLQTELISRCQWKNSNEDLSWRQKELIPRRQRKQRGIPEKESPGIFTPNYDQSWRQKKISFAGNYFFPAEGLLFLSFLGELHVCETFIDNGWMVTHKNTDELILSFQVRNICDIQNVIHRKMCRMIPTDVKPITE